MVKCWLDDDYILQEPGIIYAFLVLYIDKLRIYVRNEDSERTV